MSKRNESHSQSLAQKISQRIFFIRNEKVMLDSDLAQVYGVTTARLNEQIKRNIKRFPKDFMFQVTLPEFDRLMSQFATSKKGRGGRRKLPWVFTEHGAIMAATVLNSEQAVAMSVYVVRAFIKFREILAGNKELAKKLMALEKKLTSRIDIHEKAILTLFADIRKLLNPPLPEPEKPKQKIGFHKD